MARVQQAHEKATFLVDGFPRLALPCASLCVPSDWIVRRGRRTMDNVNEFEKQVGAALAAELLLTGVLLRLDHAV